mgnify:CR=1 FL=1
MRWALNRFICAMCRNFEINYSIELAVIGLSLQWPIACGESDAHRRILALIYYANMFFFSSRVGVINFFLGLITHLHVIGRCTSSLFLSYYANFPPEFVFDAVFISGRTWNETKIRKVPPFPISICFWRIYYQRQVFAGFFRVKGKSESFIENGRKKPGRF